MEFQDNEPSSRGNQDAIIAMLDHGLQDHVLRMLVGNSSGLQFSKLLVSIVDEGSLLEDNQDSHLTEQEQAAAEEEITMEIAAAHRAIPSPVMRHITV